MELVLRLRGGILWFSRCWEVPLCALWEETVTDGLENGGFVVNC